MHGHQLAEIEFVASRELTEPHPELAHYLAQFSWRFQPVRDDIVRAPAPHGRKPTSK
jgi:hypothetical protein